MKTKPNAKPAAPQLTWEPGSRQNQPVGEIVGKALLGAYWATDTRMKIEGNADYDLGDKEWSCLPYLPGTALTMLVKGPKSKVFKVTIRTQGLNRLAIALANPEKQREAILRKVEREDETLNLQYQKALALIRWSQEVLFDMITLPETTSIGRSEAQELYYNTAKRLGIEWGGKDPYPGFESECLVIHGQRVAPKRKKLRLIRERYDPTNQEELAVIMQEIALFQVLRLHGPEGPKTNRPLIERFWSEFWATVPEKAQYSLIGPDRPTAEALRAASGEAAIRLQPRQKREGVKYRLPKRAALHVAEPQQWLDAKAVRQKHDEAHERWMAEDQEHFRRIREELRKPKKATTTNRVRTQRRAS